MMMIRSIASGVLFFICSCAFTQQWIDKVYDYSVISNQQYGTAVNFNGEDEILTLDIYTPVCDETSQLTNRPLLVWIHGGAFLLGSKEDASIVDLCIQFARRGYVTASINYRKGFVSDNQQWNCNFPNYNCVFAHDPAEWERAYYRAIQDAKGAVRWLVSNQDELRIDPENVFVAGESAGAFIALGTGLLDDESERPVSTFEINDIPPPHTSTLTCGYNLSQSFTPDNITRPDLGGFEGNILPDVSGFVLKGIGNMYGGMLSNLLEFHNPAKPKPAIYNFHRPCDLVVPIDSGNVFQGQSWCFTNGFGCFAIANTTTVFGSRAINTWNEIQQYNYPMQSEFTTIEFPFNYWFGAGSCLDQVNNPCHAYDSKLLRENNLAAFFAPLVSTDPVCPPDVVSTSSYLKDDSTVRIFPNPVRDRVAVYFNQPGNYHLLLYDTSGRIQMQKSVSGNSADIEMGGLSSGIYILQIASENDTPFGRYKLIKN
jgi:hypothetical protein